MTKKYPLLLVPAFKDYIWGGYNLKKNYYPMSPFEKTAEAWVLSCHKDGESAVKNGELSGKTLAEAVESFDNALGKNSERFPFFPILIKMIDAEDNLSVQVHPDDEYALANEGGFGKTEMWYVVDHKPDACLYYGFKEDITREEFERRISDNTLTDVLNAVKVKKGDCFFIPAGTIHAIGKGMLIAEIQQSSNTTYRVYDYGRVGADGKPRDLHIKKALDVTSTKKTVIGKDIVGNTLADCEYFKVEKRCGTYTDFVGDDSFIALLVLDGKATLKYDGGQLDLVTADTVFIPAGMGEIMLEGEFELLETRV